MHEQTSEDFFAVLRSSSGSVIRRSVCQEQLAGVAHPTVGAGRSQLQPGSHSTTRDLD